MGSRRVGADAGFTLVEMLIASAIMLAVTAGVFALLNPAEGIFRAQPEASDMQQRIRVAADALGSALRMAGAGAYAGSSAGPLSDYFAPVLPYRIGDLDNDPAAGVHYRSDAISVIYVPSTPAQATLGDLLTTDARTLTVSTPPNCPPSTAARICGFASSTRLLVFSASGGHDVMTVTDVAPPLLQVQYAGSLSRSYAAGSPVTEVATPTYYLKTNSSQLMRYDGYRSDLPIVDNVVHLDFQYYGDPQPPRLIPGKSLADTLGPFTTYGPRPPVSDVNNPDDSWPAGENCVFTKQDDRQVSRLAVLAAGDGEVALPPGLLTDGPWCPDEASRDRFDADLLRIRRVGIRLRIQAALALLRGPAGVLFARGGTATSAERYLPDLEISVDVTPRNMSLRR